MTTGTKRRFLTRLVMVATLVSFGAVTAWSAAKPKRRVPVSEEMAFVFTKGCASTDLACTQPFAEREPRALLLGRDSATEPWLVLQNSPASYGRAEGEKQQEGDYKTPEGLYHTLGAVFRNDEHTRWGSGHIKLAYPNAEDGQKKKPRPGGGIYIHGGRGVRTLGCVRVLDPPGILQGAVHRVNMTRMLKVVSEKRGAQLPALLLPHYPERCLAAEGTPLPAECAGSLAWLIAHAGSVSNEQAVRVGGLVDPVPGGIPVPVAAPLPPEERVPLKVCAADEEALASLPALPVRIAEGRLIVDTPLGPAEAALPADGQTSPLPIPLMQGQVTFWDCNVSPESKPACLNPPEKLESGHVVVLAKGEATLFRSWMGHGIFDRHGGRAVAPFGVGILEKDGIIVQTPGGPIEYPVSFDVLTGGKPTADCPSGACSDAELAFDNDDTTAWCGKPGDALVIPHERTALLAEVSLLNGEYDGGTVAMIESGDRAGAEARWRGSRRVAGLRLESQETMSVQVADAFGDQVVAVTGGGLCMRDLRLVIESTAGGADQGCIGELELRFGNPGN